VSASPRLRRALGVFAAGTVVSLVLAGPWTGVALASGSGDAGAQAAATAKHKALNDARDQAAADKQRLAGAQAAVAGAQAQLAAMATKARTAIEHYDRAMHQLRVAQDAADAARVALAAAVADVANKQAQVNAFARASYMSGGPLGAVAVVLTSGGPAAILDEASLLGAVSQTQADMLRDFAFAQERQATMSTAANAAEQAVQRIADGAAADRRTAMDALAAQHALIGQLTAQQISVARQLADQETKVATLTVAEAAAQARAKEAQERAALAAAWVQMQAAGDAMPWASAHQGRTAVAWAKKELGVPYSWAGGDATGPTLGTVNEDGNDAGQHTVGFDCSGLTLFAWSHAGFSIDHYTGYQWVEGHHIDVGHMRPGDLVFFATDTSDPMSIHHVGIYVGGDQMIDAPHTGVNVRYDKVFVSGFIGAVRP
jgi:cell wall-associated NlpC family hydrolase